MPMTRYDLAALVVSHAATHAETIMVVESSPRYRLYMPPTPANKSSFSRTPPEPSGKMIRLPPTSYLALPASYVMLDDLSGRYKYDKTPRIGKLAAIYISVFCQGRSRHRGDVNGFLTQV